MTDEQIECAVECKMGLLDARLMNDPAFTQEMYDAAVKALDAWAEAELCKQVDPEWA